MLPNEPPERFDLRFEQPVAGGAVTLWLRVEDVELGPARFTGGDFHDIAHTLEDAGQLACPHVTYDGSGRGELVLLLERLESGRFRVRALVLGSECPPAELDADQMDDLVRVLHDVMHLIRSKAPASQPSRPRPAH